MWLIIFWAMLLFLAGVRNAAWSIDHFKRRERLPGFIFWALSTFWIIAAGGLLYVAVPG